MRLLVRSWTDEPHCRADASRNGWKVRRRTSRCTGRAGGKPVAAGATRTNGSTTGMLTRSLDVWSEVDTSELRRAHRWIRSERGCAVKDVGTTDKKR